MLTGYIVGLRSEPPEDLTNRLDEIREIVEIVDEEPLLTEEILALAIWTSEYYASSLGEMLKASLPAGINTGTEKIYRATQAGIEAAANPANSRGKRWQLLRSIASVAETPESSILREMGAAPARRALSKLAADGLVEFEQRRMAAKVKEKRRKSVRLVRREPEDDDGGRPLTRMQEHILDTLAANGGRMVFTDLLREAEAGASPVTTLARRGLVEISVEEVLRDPLADDAVPASPEAAIKLNPDQRLVLKEIESALGREKFESLLLHGVTGSGKTEVYIRAMKTTLERDQTSLMLVPEIALTPVFSRRLRAAFGRKVAILHSELSAGERFDEWRRIRNGRARIVIGTRSAVFAPLKDIGLIIVDEEHDSSYRQNESPFYHGRDVAVKRAHSADAVIVLGSATPAIESFHNAETGKYRYLRLETRVSGRPMAEAELVDMREVFKKAGRDVVFSPRLIESIKETHARGEQAIMLLNRRGFSSFVLCRSCGESLRCKNCDITMTYHRGDARLICHYCSYAATVPDVCPFCKSEYLYFIGRGTEQVETLLERRFPDLKIVRVDRDTMSRKGELSRTLFDFDAGKIDMLVGTQILAKGHDFHNVTLVGVISVDAGLGMPDFRSAERTFQLLTQVAGRAGRGDLPGRVIIQTYYPEHYALRLAAEQNYEAFYKEEVKYRQRLSYPPFVVVASLMIKHRDHGYAMRSARILRDALDRANREKKCRILGPAQASISRIKEQFRIQIILKSESRKSLRSLIDLAIAEAETRGADRRIIFIEIDPVNLM
jgi:primosomal protein N' (replication factor Y) (superfamily II helicase)